jgi:hypothetical protein
MNIEKGKKIIASKPNSKSRIEIKRHKDPIMDIESDFLIL